MPEKDVSTSMLSRGMDTNFLALAANLTDEALRAK